MMTRQQPLDGLLVVDFSTLVPGPLASLCLAEAGATVVKIERPGGGDEMRSYVPKAGTDSVNFVLLNRGKHSMVIDLKAADAHARLLPLIERADVLIEQFRPGVMDRLGLGFEALKAINPRLIYCSISGWGQTGPKRDIAAHDLNYVTETGALALTKGADGAPVLPPVLIADIGGGAYPALINILLALQLRNRTGDGSYLDIAMGDNMFPLMYWGLGNGHAAGAWPRSGGDLVTGGSPRYQIYRAADGRYIAAAPLEDKFWANFCRIIELPADLQDPAAPAEGVLAEVARRIGARTSEEWRQLFEGQDICCSVVGDLEMAVADPHFAARGLFDHSTMTEAGALPALPVPVVGAFRTRRSDARAPALGQHDPSIARASGEAE